MLNELALICAYCSRVLSTILLQLLFKQPSHLILSFFCSKIFYFHFSIRTAVSLGGNSDYWQGNKSIVDYGYGHIVSVLDAYCSWRWRMHGWIKEVRSYRIRCMWATIAGATRYVPRPGVMLRLPQSGKVLLHLSKPLFPREQYPGWKISLDFCVKEIMVQLSHLPISKSKQGNDGDCNDHVLHVHPTLSQIPD